MNKNYLAVIKKKRQELKINKSEMSEKLGVSVSMYGKYEEGESKLDVDKFIEICEILELSWSNFEESNNKKEEIIENLSIILKKLKDL
jgi:transcriptional regulator with XRE-family HTH domain